MFIFTYVVSKIIESPEDLSINEVSFLLKGKKQSFFLFLIWAGCQQAVGFELNRLQRSQKK